MNLPTWNTIKADCTGFIAKVKSCLVYLEAEGVKAINWVESVDPQAAAVMAQFVQSAEADAVILEQAAAKGLGTLVTNLTGTLGTTVANVVSGLKLPVTATGALTAEGTSLLSDASQIIHAVISNEMVKAIAVTAPARAAPAAPQTSSLTQ